MEVCIYVSAPLPCGACYPSPPARALMPYCVTLNDKRWCCEATSDFTQQEPSVHYYTRTSDDCQNRTDDTRSFANTAPCSRHVVLGTLLSRRLSKNSERFFSRPKAAVLHTVFVLKALACGLPGR